MLNTYIATEADWNTTELIDQYTVAETTTGPYCGYCGHGTRHATAGAVRVCYDLGRMCTLTQEAEIAAEAAVERYFEDRGYWEARAQEDYEARMGVIPFDVAYAAAMGH